MEQIRANAHARHGAAAAVAGGNGSRRFGRGSALSQYGSRGLYPVRPNFPQASSPLGL